MKIAVPLTKVGEESFHNIGSMEQLEAVGKLKLVVRKTVQEKRVPFDDEEFASCVVTHEINGTRVDIVVPENGFVTALIQASLMNSVSYIPCQKLFGIRHDDVSSKCP